MQNCVLILFFVFCFLFFGVWRDVRLLLLMILNKTESCNILKGKAKWEETGIPAEFVQ